MSTGDHPVNGIPDLADATDEDLDSSETVVPIVSRPNARGFQLELRGRTLQLPQGSVLIGRSAACQLVLEDNLVSRRHALLVVKAESAKIKDLDSANGVYVNGVRIQESVQLSPGDRIVIGKEEMVFRQSAAVGAKSKPAKYLGETLHGTETAPYVGPRRGYPDESEMTAQGQALELLGGVADKVLVLGRGEEAERILGASLLSLLAKAKESGGIEDELAEKAASYAMKLARATGKGRWADYAFQLYTAVRRPLPTEHVDQLYKMLRNLQGINVAVLSEYVAALRASQGRFGPAERFLLLRIEGLERLLK